MKKLSRYRCFITVFLFLFADFFSVNWTPAGKATWYLYPLAGLAAIPFYKLWVKVCYSIRDRGGFVQDGLKTAYGILAVLMIGTMAGQLSLFVTVNDDFSMSSVFVAGLSVVTALYLASLKGHGFARYTDVTFFWVALCLAVFFATGFSVLKFGRLLPVYEGENMLMAGGLIKLFLAPFAGGFIAIAALTPEADSKDLYPAACWASIAASVVLGLEHVKNISAVGYEVAVRFTFPAYTTAGVQDLNSYGIHIEEVLICGLILARIVKTGVLLRFAGRCLESMSKKKLGSRAWMGIAAATGGAVGLAFMSTSESMQRWLGIRVTAMGVMCFILPLLLAGGERLRRYLAGKRNI